MIFCYKTAFNVFGVFFLGFRPISKKCDFCRNDTNSHLVIHYCMTYESHVKLCYDCHTLHIGVVNSKYFNGGRDGECVVSHFTQKMKHTNNDPL